MSKFAENIAPFFEAELRLAREADRAGRADVAFSHLERAHVLGQSFTYHSAAGPGCHNKASSALTNEAGRRPR